MTHSKPLCLKSGLVSGLALETRTLAQANDLNSLTCKMEVIIGLHTSRVGVYRLKKTQRNMLIPSPS